MVTGQENVPLAVTTTSPQVTLSDAQATVTAEPATVVPSTVTVLFSARRVSGVEVTDIVRSFTTYGVTVIVCVMVTQFCLRTVTTIWPPVSGSTSGTTSVWNTPPS